MVGRPTSFACSTCRKRKIKCDLARPACRKCIEADWTCPGYSDRFTSCGANTCHSTITRDVTAASACFDIGIVPYTPLSNAEKLRIEFIYAMERNLLAAKLTMMPKMHILMYIPERIGHSPALDDAVRCVTHLGPSSLYDDSLLQQQNYVRALRSLQKALESPLTMHAPETLASASILQMYEVHTDLLGHKWVHHARGAIRMLRFRGPMDVSSGVQRAILAAEAAEMFLNALKTRQFHFLGRSGWCLPVQAVGARDRAVDKFMRVIVDGTRFDDVGSFCTYFASSCEFERMIPWERHDQLAKGNILDLLRLRQDLHCVRADLLALAKLTQVQDPMEIAALTAIESFLLTTVSYILWSRQHSAKLTRSKLEPLPENLTEVQLEEERMGLLQSATAYSNTLADMDRELRNKTSAALQVIMASLSATAIPGIDDRGESAVLLKMLEPTFEDALWT